MTYAQMVAKLRCKAQGLTPGWEHEFAEEHALTPTHVQDMIAGRAPIYPHLVADLAAIVGLKLQLTAAPDAHDHDVARLGSLP